MKNPRLRDSGKLNPDINPLGVLTDDIILSIAMDITYLSATGRNDITGNDWGDIFANAINGRHLSSPIGIVDVFKNHIGWSVKTVKASNVFSARSIRLISGRCSPDYSFGINNPHDDIQKTGEAVIAIWNSRVDIAYSHYSPCRTAVLIRDNTLTEFCFFEEYLEHYNITDFFWKENKNGNLEAFDQSGIKRFAWQPHGSQFTILTPVPGNALRFRLRQPDKLSQEQLLNAMGFNKDWIEIIEQKETDI